jgi:hypothetical protein
MTTSTHRKDEDILSRVQRQELESVEEQRALVTGVLRGMNPFRVESAVSRAPRRELDAAGRQLEIGGNVAAMVKELLFLDGKGEDPDGFIHKTAREWSECDAALTKRKVKTAEQVGLGEGLWQIEHRSRPSDGRETVYYRLNMWELCRVVVRSELDHIQSKLNINRRPKERDALEERRAELLRTKEDLNLFGDADPGPGGPSGEADPNSRVTSCGPSDDKLHSLQPNTQAHTVMTSNTSYSRCSDELNEEKIMKMIYRRFKQEGVTIARKEYARNLHKVRWIVYDELHLSAAEEEWLLDQQGLTEENLDELRTDLKEFTEEFVEGVWQRYEEHGELDVDAVWRLDGYSNAVSSWRNWLKDPFHLRELDDEAPAQEAPVVTESPAAVPGGYRAAEIVHPAEAPIPEFDEPPEIPRETFDRCGLPPTLEDCDTTTEAGTEPSAAPNERSPGPATKPPSPRKLTREESRMLYRKALESMGRVGGSA